MELEIKRIPKLVIALFIAGLFLGTEYLLFFSPYLAIHAH
jgi:hypothetical protein